MPLAHQDQQVETVNNTIIVKVCRQRRRRPPSDLRKLKAKSGGRFDEAEVMAYIDGRRFVAEHGLREMPVWGAVFEEENRPKHYPAYTSLLHSRALTDYLRSIQE